MQRPWILALAACTPLAIYASALPNPNPAPLPNNVQQEHAETATADEHGALEEAMESIKSGVRRLRRSLRDPEQDSSSLATVTAIQVASIQAKHEVPPMASSLPEGEQAAFAKAYREEMIRMVRASLTLEMAILDGDREKIQEAFSAMRALEDPAHERFTEDE